MNNNNSTFQPSEHDVVCGRGRGFYNRPGNKRFREIVCQHIPEYLTLKTKLDKSMLLNRIIDLVRRHHNARFIKKNANGAWHEIEENATREKVGHAMREAIAAKKQAPQAVRQAVAKAHQQAARQVSHHQSNLLAQQQELFAKLLALSNAKEKTVAASC